LQRVDLNLKEFADSTTAVVGALTSLVLAVVALLNALLKWYREAKRWPRWVVAGIILLALSAVLFAVVHVYRSPPSIRITLLPALSNSGGPDSEGQIGGEVDGVCRPQDFRVVIYAYTNRWYVQPERDRPLIGVMADGTWRTETHLGSKYAALLVEPSYEPPASPTMGKGVLAFVTQP
jgi:hypothetical protein